jgi:hypothetical protein
MRSLAMPVHPYLGLTQISDISAADQFICSELAHR